MINHILALVAVTKIRSYIIFSALLRAFFVLGVGANADFFRHVFRFKWPPFYFDGLYMGRMN